MLVRVWRCLGGDCVSEGVEVFRRSVLVRVWRCLGGECASEGVKVFGRRVC